MTRTKQIIQGWLDALENPRRELTAWEDDFVVSVEEQFNARGVISDRQEEILEKIYAEKT